MKSPKIDEGSAILCAANGLFRAGLFQRRQDKHAGNTVPGHDTHWESTKAGTMARVNQVGLLAPGFNLYQILSLNRLFNSPIQVGCSAFPLPGDLNQTTLP